MRGQIEKLGFAFGFTARATVSTLNEVDHTPSGTRRGPKNDQMALNFGKQRTA